jgi:1-deoxy-D-xylulose-5-phosphate synthase
VDVLAEPGPGPVDVLVVAVGAMATDALGAAAICSQAGYSVRVVDPRWVTPVDPGLVDLCRQAQLVVTVEDGVVTGGVGARLAQTLPATGTTVAMRQIGIPAQFLEHGKVAEVRARIGLTPQAMGRRMVEWAAVVTMASDQLPADQPSDRGDVR